MRRSSTDRIASREGLLTRDNYRILEGVKEFRKITFLADPTDYWYDGPGSAWYTGFSGHQHRSAAADLAQRMVVVILAILRRPCPIDLHIPFISDLGLRGDVARTYLGQLHLYASNSHDLRLVFIATRDRSGIYDGPWLSRFFERAGKIFGNELGDADFRILLAA